ncbi:MAG TPA: hypothetical protein VL400_17475 [Polyangiaceae bacterium]|nr:hypothetical protein [Polyangiaceae bacterium]
MSQNRYLSDASGSDVSSRVRASVYTFGPLVGVAVLGALAGAVSAASTEAAVLLGLTAAVTFLAWPVMLWIFLFRGAKDLERSTHALLWGGVGSPIDGCHRVLRRVFRADQRARAFHLLGLYAERSGDFPDAAECFARALGAIPAMGSVRPRKYARLVMSAHRAFCLLASGRLDEGQALLGQTANDFLSPTQPGAFDALMDDSAMGLGSLSLNETLMKIEGGRDPRALISLSWALAYYARGATSDALRVLTTERWFLDHGLAPRELAVAQWIYAELAEPSAAGAAPTDPWITSVLRGARPELARASPLRG